MTAEHGEALATFEPCQGGDELHELHLTYCVPFYEARRAAGERHACPHANVRTLRSHPPRSTCSDCGADVERRWVEVCRG